MATISSNTLFHFTSTADNIIRIIKSGFTPKFCLEGFGSEIIIGERDIIEEAAPMTCFCDLPLSQIDEHLEFYGSYGIGLSKEWGKENGLSPLTYIHEKSTQLSYLRRVGKLVYNQFAKMGFEKMLNEIPLENNQLLALMELAAFMKPYHGRMWRIDKYVEKRFYDEREWRYVPFINSQETEYRLSKDEYLNEITRAAANEMISQKFVLKFKAIDIKYLIVKKEIEMIALSDALDTLKGIYTNEEVKILKTRIISCEQIKEDF